MRNTQNWSKVITTFQDIVSIVRHKEIKPKVIKVGEKVKVQCFYYCFTCLILLMQSVSNYQFKIIDNKIFFVARVVA